MKLLTIVFLAISLTLTLCATVQLPEGLTDGSYMIGIDEAGLQTVTEITPNSTTLSGTPPILNRDLASSRLNKRFIWPSGTYPVCPSGDWLSSNDFYGRGWDAFWWDCHNNGAHKFPKNTILANYQGTSVSYMCAYTTNPCNTDEWADAVNWAAGNCWQRSGGWMQPGMFGSHT